MAEQLLDRTQIGAVFEQVGSEGVAQGVRMRFAGQPAGDGECFEDAADGTRGEAGNGACVRRIGIGL